MGLFNNGNTFANRVGGLRNIYNTVRPSLNLSADQETKIEQVLAELKEERKNFKTQGAGNIEEMKAARKQARQQIMDILNPAQKQIWRDNLEKLKEEKK